MCNVNESISVVLAALFIATGARCAVLQHRFAVMLRRDEPGEWNVIATWRTWSEDGDLHESAVFSYIAQGLFRSIQHPVLVRLGSSCRRWYLALLFALLALGAHSMVTNTFAPIACMWS